MFPFVRRNFLTLCVVIIGLSLVLTQSTNTKRSQDSLFIKLLDSHAPLRDISATSLEPLSKQSQLLSTRYEKPSASRGIQMDRIILELLREQMGASNQLPAYEPKVNSRPQQLANTGIDSVHNDSPKSTGQQDYETSKVDQLSEEDVSRSNDGNPEILEHIELAAGSESTTLKPQQANTDAFEGNSFVLPPVEVANSNANHRLICWMESTTKSSPSTVTSSARQFNAPANPISGPQRPVDLLSLVQKGLMEGKNLLETQIDEQFGVSLPTNIIEKKPDKLFGNLDEARKLDNGKNTTQKFSGKSLKAMQNKISTLSARVAVYELVGQTIQSLLQLVSTIVTGGDQSKLTGTLQEVLTLLSSLLGSK